MSEDRHSQPAEANDIVAEFPLSATQTRCWFLDRMQPGNPSLNVAVRWELRGQVQTANIERAFQHVIRESTSERVAEKYLDLYAELVERRASRP